MKKIIIFIMLLMGVNLFSQQPEIVIDTKLTPYVQEYINEAYKRNLLVDEAIIESIDSIKFDSRVQFPYWGFLLRGKRKLILNHSIKIDPKFMRAVVFHELTHVFLIGHSKDSTDLMYYNSNVPIEKLYIEEEWQKIVDKLFEQVKEGKYKN